MADSPIIMNALFDRTKQYGGAPPAASVRIVIMIIVWLAKAEAERSHLDSEPLLRPGRARRERESTERGRGDGKGGHAAKPQPSDLAQHPDFLRRADNQSLA